MLGVLLAAAIAALVYYFLKLDEANARIDEQNQEIDEQKELIDKKETFGAAVAELLDTASQFYAVLVGDVVDLDAYESTVRSAWFHRWEPLKLDEDIASIRASTDELGALATAATLEATTNGSGTTYEAVIDQLSGGYASSLIDNADALCESDVLACVTSDNPTVIHFDAADTSLEYMTDELKTGTAYHEYAHVLQFTNPEPTETALAAFGGDSETMADCFALTYLPGWKLDHRIWINSYSWWDVSLGYGLTCDESQRQAVRDWYGSLGYEPRALSQER